MSSRIPTKQALFMLIYMVSMKHGLRSAGSGLRTTHYGLGVKHRLRYKTRITDWV